MGNGYWLSVISYQNARFTFDNQTVIIIFENIKGHSLIYRLRHNLSELDLTTFLKVVKS
jgi:hypothetical protein